MHVPEFVYRTPVQSWEHFVLSFLRLSHHRLGSKQRMRRYRARRAYAAELSIRAKKDAMQCRLEQVLAGKEEWVHIGCSSKQLRTHIASQFVHQMGWHNQEEWFVDYIVPRCAFAQQHQTKAFHYSNLRPAWGRFGFPTYTRSHNLEYHDNDNDN